MGAYNLRCLYIFTANCQHLCGPLVYHALSSDYYAIKLACASVFNDVFNMRMRAPASA